MPFAKCAHSISRQLRGCGVLLLLFFLFSWSCYLDKRTSGAQWNSGSPSRQNAPFASPVSCETKNVARERASELGSRAECQASLAAVVDHTRRKRGRPRLGRSRGPTRGRFVTLTSALINFSVVAFQGDFSAQLVAVHPSASAGDRSM